MMRRFYSPEINVDQNQLVLVGEEHHHARNVLRLEAGEDISVFDGLGREFLCRIDKLDKKEADLTVLREIDPTAPESPVEITLASVAIPGDKYDLVVQKAVELGVVNFVPLTSARCELKLKDLGKKIDRWRRIALDASKQCGRARLMTIQEVLDARDLTASTNNGHLRIFFSERAGWKMPSSEQPKMITAVIGPKGGWEDAEIESAEAAGFNIVTLGGRIMRAETAAISLTAILQNKFGDLN
ncbi:MAG TPA: 16S rRNA (uracil(1498)-N(3))-methyltransferase [Pyrinomonadaceae bacterium]|jgi:16S rRNA (uracil1498-N3)-methyltransferase|nr:16S rRNA (uracil(1498)-N(3))-methyltransferase [Pyrinomonadaceae bacterium]